LASSPPSPWILEKLGRQHERAGFDCGNPVLNEWLKLRAGQYAKRDLARTYVAVREGERVVLGYYAITNHRVRYEILPEAQAKGLPKIDVPVVLLGRLAADRTVQGQGLGSLLLIDALRRAQYLSEHVGIRAVEVDAIDEAARRFYLKFNSTALIDDPNHPILPVHTIRKLNLPPLRPGGEESDNG
jgi:GNAT superfamily N-acetyltransferase